MNSETKRHIDAARQVLVGVVPNPTSQIDQITNALIYKFMDDMDQSAIKVGGKPGFFIGDLEKYAWTRLMDTRIGNQERMNIYTEALLKFSESKQLPDLFRSIFRSAFLPYRSPEVLGLFLKEISYFDYSHSEELGNGYEYLLSIMSSQGDAGQFRTPRHIIDFMVEVVDPKKDDKVLDPACGTAGFLISAYKHILKQHDGVNSDGSKNSERPLTPDERKALVNNFEGYDIDPGMVRIAQVNMYLHQFKNPKIFQYDTLSSEERWNDKFDVILANPPFMSPKGGVQTHNKFSIQSSRSEVLFVDYFMNHLRPKGRAGIIVPEGIIFQSRTAYKQLRKNIVEDGLYAVVSLPSGVFQPYSGVKTSILLFDNELAKKCKEILFVKIENDGFSLGAQRHASTANDLPESLNTIQEYRNFILTGNTHHNLFIERIKGNEKIGEIISLTHDKFSVVSKSKISEDGDYNLSGDRYRVAMDHSHTKWPMVELGDFCVLHRGVVYSKNDEVTSDGYKILRANNISLDDTLLLDNIKLISKDLKLKDSQKLKTGDIFICLASGSKNHIGKVAYINDNTDFYFGGFMGAIRISNNSINSLYLFHLLKDQKFNDFLGQEISGANINNLNFGILSHYKIPLPPLEIQEQIVEELEGYQKIITGAKQIVASWKPKIDIDPEWVNVKLGEVIDVLTDYTANGSFASLAQHAKYTKAKDYAVVVRLTDLRKSMISDEMNYVSEESYNFLKKSSLVGGEYLIANVGANLGDSYIMPFIKTPATLGPNMYLVKFNQKTSNEYIQIITQQFIKPRILELSISAAQPKINKDQFRSIEIPLPPIEEQKQIVGKIEAERKLVESAKKLIEIYEQKTKEAIAKLWDE